MNLRPTPKFKSEEDRIDWEEKKEAQRWPMIAQALLFLLRLYIGGLMTLVLYRYLTVIQEAPEAFYVGTAIIMGYIWLYGLLRGNAREIRFHFDIWWSKD